MLGIETVDNNIAGDLKIDKVFKLLLIRCHEFTPFGVTAEWVQRNQVEILLWARVVARPHRFLDVLVAPCVSFVSQQVANDPTLSRFSLFDNPFLPETVRAALKAGENIKYELVVNFDDAVARSLCVTALKGRGFFNVSMNNTGLDQRGKPRGYFAQVQDVSQYRRVEEQLRHLQVATEDSAESKAGISGSLVDMSFTDMIQVLCAGGKSAEIQLVQEDLKASVYLQDGNIVHCDLGGKTGPDAFYELMRWQAGDFTTKQCAEFPEATIASSPMALLMEGARLADEMSGG